MQDTAKEMAKEVQLSRTSTGDIKQTAEDLDKFLNKVNCVGLRSFFHDIKMCVISSVFMMIWN